MWWLCLPPVTTPAAAPVQASPAIAPTAARAAAPLARLWECLCCLLRRRQNCKAEFAGALKAAFAVTLGRTIAVDRLSAITNDVTPECFILTFYQAALFRSAMRPVSHYLRAKMFCLFGGCVLERFDSLTERRGSCVHRVPHFQEHFGEYLEANFRFQSLRTLT